MVAQVRDVSDEVKAPVPDFTPSVVVAAVARVEAVPQAKPCSVASTPPVAEIEPFKVPAVVVREEAAEVVTVAAVILSMVIDIEVVA